MSFDLVSTIFFAGLILAIIIVVILAYPGPKKEKKR